LPKLVALSFILILLLLPIASTTAVAQTVLLDTFDTGTTGQAPGFPEIGSSSNTPVGAHTLVDPGANGDLRVRCNDDATNDGCRLSYTPTASSESAVTRFLFRVESGVVASGSANDFDQQLILSPPGTNLSLEWSAFIGQLGVRIFAGGAETQSFVPGFLWSVDTDYDVEIGTDATTDRYTVSIDGQMLVDEALDADFTSLDRITIRSGFPTTGASQVDDVEILQVPEAGPLASAMAALATVCAIRYRRRASRSSRLRTWAMSQNSAEVKRPGC